MAALACWCSSENRCCFFVNSESPIVADVADSALDSGQDRSRLKHEDAPELMRLRVLHACTRSAAYSSK